MTNPPINTPGDEHLVATLLNDPSRLRDAAVATIAQRAGGAARWVATHDASAAACVELIDGAARYGYLASDDIPADTLRAHAAWMTRWLQLADRIERLNAEAKRDALTGVWNRRMFDTELHRLVDFAGREGRSVTLLLFDVDNLKDYNETYGHPAGDEVLRDTALLMQSSVRAHDIVARIGGDEFAVIFWDAEPRRETGSAHPHDVYRATARFRRAIADHRFPRLGRNARGALTVSGGLARFPDDADSAEQLIEIADIRLLDAKHRGKNAFAFGGMPDAPTDTPPDSTDAT